MTQNVTNTLATSLSNSLLSAVAFLPNAISGLIVLVIGILLGSLVKRLLVNLFSILKIESYLKKYGVPEAKEEFTWTNILAEIARWFIIVLFLVPTADIWGLSQVATILNTFLLYLPNVFIAAIIGLVGFVFAQLASNVVRASSRKLTPKGSRMVASVVRISIIIFVLLAVLNQLGVAQDLIRILFAGFVAMIALAGGIAFGLGGKDLAKTLIESSYKKLK